MNWMRASSTVSVTGSAPGVVDSPADIDDSGALFSHPHRIRKRRIRCKETLPVGKRIQRHIEDSNDGLAGAYPIEEDTTLGALSRAHRPFLSCADIRSGSA
jgi:hypothetical protein